MKTTKAKNGKATDTAANLAAGWVKLARLLVAYGELRLAAEDFGDDAPGRALLDAAPGLREELGTIRRVLAESEVIVAEAAAGAVAGQVEGA